MSEKIEDLKELLLRQVHPRFIDENGIPATDRFRPSERDNGKMSVDRSSLVTPQESYARYTALGRESGGVFGLLVEEFAGESIDCFEDPITEAGKENPAHAIADYSPFDLKSQKLISKRLCQLARKRGPMYLKDAEEKMG